MGRGTAIHLYCPFEILRFGFEFVLWLFSILSFFFFFLFVLFRFSVVPLLRQNILVTRHEKIINVVDYLRQNFTVHPTSEQLFFFFRGEGRLHHNASNFKAIFFCPNGGHGSSACLFFYPSILSASNKVSAPVLILPAPMLIYPPLS